jgi:hypothetical protein
MKFSPARLGDTPLHPLPHTAYHWISSMGKLPITGLRVGRPQGEPGYDLQITGVDSNVG